jgi:hypothetical protein
VAEGLSAGAMLTCVAAAMIPEAIHLGGEGAGFVLGTYAQPRHPALTKHCEHGAQQQPAENRRLD